MKAGISSYILWAFNFFGQEGNESSTSSNLSVVKNRPASEMNGQSPAHQKVQRSVSSNQKTRRYSDQGGIQLDHFKFAPIQMAIPHGCLNI